MSAKVEVTRSVSVPLDQIELTTKEMMREVGLQMRERIVRRTRQGQGVNGPLAPLSERYAEQKAKALGTSQPDLTVSGNMLNDITIVDLTDESVTLGWNQ